MKKYVKMGISTVFVIVLIVGCYYYMTHRETKTADDGVEVTQLHQVLDKQLDNSYPPTPREVIKFYNRIIECAYGDEYNDEQFQRLASQARKLMDEELLANNPEEAYKTKLQTEVQSYQEEYIANVKDIAALTAHKSPGGRSFEEYLEELLEVLNLKERRNHLPNQLSGGQQQRVAIGRALFTRPSLILADEPTGNLDTQNSSEVIALLKEASKKYEQTIIMITHSRSIAQTADRVLNVSDGVLTDLGRCRE